jgi:hypothetical protein
MQVDVGGIHNHHVSVAERVIQTFKDHFISVLAITDSNIPLQLWDRLAPQVQNALNRLCPLHQRTGTLYNNLTGLFPFQSLEGNICFLVVYHFKTNAILALLINGFSNKIIFATYKQQYEMLESKGHVIRLNIMDNQASQTIK